MSLFGISFTLMVLMVLVAMIDHLISASAPDTERDRNLYLLQTRLEDKAGTSNSNNPAGFYFLNHYVKKLKTPEKVSLYKIPEVNNAFSRNQKFALNTRFTDAEYWEVLKFNFLEGKPYDHKLLEKREPVAVISKSTRDNYYGKGVSAIGKTIKANNIDYKVIGVVEDVPPTNIHAFGDLYLPYTVSSIDFNERKSLRGMFFCIVQASSPDQFPEIQEEFNQMVAGIDIQSFHQGYDILKVSLDTYLGCFTRVIFGNANDDKKNMFYIVVGGFMLLFMLLPAINLVNMNITRIMERASEIGVRKAFGASNGNLISQFLIENVIITFIGGFISILLTFIVLQILNASQFIPHADLGLNYKVFLMGLGVTFLFGIVSGVYPAFRMSKMQAASVLRGKGE